MYNFEPIANSGIDLLFGRRSPRDTRPSSSHMNSYIDERSEKKKKEKNIFSHYLHNSCIELVRESVLFKGH